MSGLATALPDLALKEPIYAWVALIALGVLALGALLRRPRQIAMPSLPLWEQALAGSLMNRFLPLLRLIRTALTALAILLAGVLCAGPIERERGALDWLLIVDLSPSMDAIEADGRSRLELATEAATRFVQSLPAEDRVDLMLATDPPRLGTAPGAKRAEVLQAMTTLRTEAPVADLAGAWSIAEGLAQVPVLFSDAAGQRAMTLRPVRARTFGVGERDANRALLACEVETPYLEPARVRWQLKSYGGALLPSELELVDPQGERTLVASDGTEFRGSYELPANAAGIWTLRMTDRDALGFDDAVRFGIDGIEPRGVALRAGGSNAVHPALAVAFELAAQSFEVPLRWLASDELPRADEVLVQDGGELRSADVPAAGAILFGTSIAEWIEAAPNDAERAALQVSAAPVRIESARGTLRGLPLDRWRVRRAHLKPAVDRVHETWIAGPDRPLLFAMEINGTRIVSTSFDLRESNVPGEASFAVLAHRLLFELAGPKVRTPPFFHAGQSMAPWMRSATDAIAGGTLREDWPTAPLGIPAVLPREGSLTLEDRTIPIELLDADASDIKPGWAPGWNGAEPARPEQSRPLGQAVLFALLLVLLARATLDLLATT